MRNWKTTSAGIVAIGTALGGLMALLGPLVDGDFATIPDWKGIGVAVGAIVAGIGLLNARDAAPVAVEPSGPGPIEPTRPKTPTGPTDGAPLDDNR